MALEKSQSSKTFKTTLGLLKKNFAALASLSEAFQNPIYIIFAGLSQF